MTAYFGSKKDTRRTLVRAKKILKAPTKEGLFPGKSTGALRRDWCKETTLQLARGSRFKIL